MKYIKLFFKCIILYFKLLLKIVMLPFLINKKKEFKMNTAVTLGFIFFVMVCIVVSNVRTANKRKNTFSKKDDNTQIFKNDVIDMNRTTGIY